jgi:SNF2 family DNA or RNA helicase
VKNNKKLVIYSTWLDFGVNIIESKLEEQKIPYAIIKGATTKEERFDIVKQYNKDKINVLLITSAGAEGLDLKNTRSVIILEPFWHTSRIQQVIGRAVRYKSHETLPESERYVDVYNLLLEKNEKYPDESGLDSADMLLYKKSINKHSVIKQFTNQMIESSIELNKC